jgi:hypothetical protein
MPQKKTRTVIKIDTKQFLKYAGRISNGNLPQGQAMALEMIRDCAYAQKGLEKRSLSIEESAQQLSKAFS